MRASAVSRERRALYSPIGLRVLDALTGEAPRSQVTARLFLVGVSAGDEEVLRRPVRTPSGILTYPGLERRARVQDPNPRRYRVEIDAPYYLPLYRGDAAGIFFDSYPYSDTTPPRVIPDRAQDVLLLPGPDYPFGAEVRVLHGLVIDVSKRPMADIIVRYRGAIEFEQTLTNDRGAFSLPLRFADAAGPVLIEAVDLRTGRQGTIRVALPTELGRAHFITIN